MSIGQTLLARRQEMGLSLSALSKEIGGSPNESFIAKIERGEVTPSLSTAERLAAGLRLPREVVINASGHATDDQVEKASLKLIEMVGSPHPVLRSVAYRSADTKRGAIGRRQIMLKPSEDAFVVDFGPESEPLDGQAVVVTNRDPQPGQPVACEVEGFISAWTWHDGQEPWIENGAGERRATGFKLLGVIVQVTKATRFD